MKRSGFIGAVVGLLLAVSATAQDRGALEGRWLLDFDRQAALQTLDCHLGDHVRYVAGDAVDRLGLSALLVRPDGFVVWASDTAARREDVVRAAASWFASRQS